MQRGGVYIIIERDEEGVVHMENKLGELVKLAKGDDRTIKEYANDSNVDAAVISKIISGKYVPQKHKVFQALTSINAAPRGGVSFEQLVEAAGQIASYTGMITDAVTTAFAIPCDLPIAMLNGAAMASGNVVKKKKKIVASNTEQREVEGERQRFAATSIGIIYGQMARKGIMFRPLMMKAEQGGKNNDSYVSIEDREICEYTLRHVFMGEKECKSEVVVESVGKDILEALIFEETAADKKLSIVVNSVELYEYFQKFKGKLAYRGNLSVILIDLHSVSVSREEILSGYNLGEEETLLKII